MVTISLERPQALSPVLSSRWPDAGSGLILVVLLAYVLPPRLIVSGVGAVGRPAVLAAFGLMVWWLCAKLVPGLSIQSRQPIRVAVGLFLLAYSSAFAFGLGRQLPVEEASGANRAAITTLALCGVTLVTADGIRTRKRLDQVLRMLLAGGLIMAVVGILQHWFDYDLTPRIRFPGLTLNSGLIGVGARGSELLARVAGTAGHYIEYGVLMGMLLPLAIHYLRFAADRLQRRFYLLVTVTIALAMFFSVSRAAILTGAVAMLFLVPAWRWRDRLNAACWAFIFLVLVRATQPGLLGTIKSLFLNMSNDPSITGRTNDYAQVGRYISERPWFGRGPGTFSPDRYLLLDNQWLATVISIGFVGGVALLLLLLTAVTLGKRVGRLSTDASARHLGHAIGASILGGMVASFTFDSLSFTTFALTLFLLIGAAGALWRLESDRGTQP
jgi:O-antigen ligase